MAKDGSTTSVATRIAETLHNYGVRFAFGIPGNEDGAGRWSVDHLFLDQDAIPTLVEVKRSTDTRIRREVVL